jgi:hypothetical protein
LLFQPLLRNISWCITGSISLVLCARHVQHIVWPKPWRSD